MSGKKGDLISDAGLKNICDIIKPLNMRNPHDKMMFEMGAKKKKENIVMSYRTN